MTEKTPWDEIHIPETDYNVRLVGGCGLIPVFWGKDSQGRPNFIVELAGDHAVQFRDENLSIRGISTDLRQFNNAGNQGLVLTLEKNADLDLFHGLCNTLLTGLLPAHTPSVALAVAIAHLKRWKVFMSGRQGGLLSWEQIRGLFAELQFLRSLYGSHYLDKRSAVESWYGGEGGQQDFIFLDLAVEIKSISSRERNAVRISSEDQLETQAENLFLVIYRLLEAPQNEQTLSLNELVSQIEHELSDAEAIESFLKKLSAYGYLPLKEYDKPYLSVGGPSAYKVEENFPRLIRSEIPSGIVRVSYDLEMEDIDKYKCSLELAFGRK